jgi:hypothetical protein
MQMQIGTLFVTTRDETGGALPGVIVSAGLGTDPPASTVTDEDGQVLFLDLVPGTYTVGAQLEGFAPARRDAAVQPGKRTELGIVLRPAVSGEPVA